MAIETEKKNEKKNVAIKQMERNCLPEAKQARQRRRQPTVQTCVRIKLKKKKTVEERLTLNKQSTEQK